MMFGLSNIPKFVVDIILVILVVAGVLVFTYFDPLGLLVTKRQKLQNTPVSVQSIREIGQLITAEYYGEVITSLQNKYLDSLQAYTAANQLDSLTKIDTQVKAAIQTLVDDETVKKGLLGINFGNRLLEKYQSLNRNLLVHTYYPIYLDYMDFQYNADEKKLIKLIYDDLEQGDQRRYVFDSTDFKNYIENFQEELQDDRSFLKKQIVMLGRGWVKAGFDFSDFSQDDFVYQKERGRIYIFGLKPAILNADINPWFIPEKGIKGFEILVATAKVKEPEYLNLVKQDCLDKLIAQAESRKILDQAKANAESNLRDLFSLLMDQEISSVSIYSHSLNYHYDYLLRDSVISWHELPVIDSILMQNFKIDKEQTLEFRNRIDSIVVEKDNFSLDTLNRYHSLVYHLLEGDYTLSSKDLELLAHEKNRIKNNLNGQRQKFDYLDSAFYGYSEKDKILLNTSKMADDFNNALMMMVPLTDQIQMDTVSIIEEDTIQKQIMSYKFSGSGTF